MLQFNMRSLIRRTRPRLAVMRRALVLRPIIPTAVLMGNLERLYMRVVRRWWEGSRDQLLPAYRSAIEREAARARQSGVVMDDEGLAGVINALSQEVDRLVLELTPDLREWVVVVERWHRSRWAASLVPSGVDLKTLIGPEDVRTTMETVVQQNVSLVRNVSDTTRRRIEQIVFQGFQQRLPARTIAKQLSEAVGIERRRAMLIATDQTQKLSAQLDTERMQQAGLDEFEWQHSGKVHARPHHKARDGKRFKLVGEIPPDDMPGIPPWCGCHKRAVLTLAE
jgi:SPP1 gp7 family putative phage head morphogenesis protein